MTETKKFETFEELGLSPKMLEAITKKGFEKPSPIQSAVIPLLLQNTTDVIGQAQTGTGKTAAFGVPLLEHLLYRVDGEKAEKGKKPIKALILTPTRELAIQVAEEIDSLHGDRNFRVIPIYGGQSYTIQIANLKKGVDIVVGTPGRVMDHMDRRTLDISQIDFFILDEADEMLNMGFIDDIKTIFEKTNPNKRVMLFSATMPREIQRVAEKYMGKYELIKVASPQMTAIQTEQIYFEVNHHDKFEALSRIIDLEEDFYGIVFCKTKLDVDAVASHLIQRGYMAEGLHGDIQQKQREKILARFKKKSITILVATDVAARGIDVNDISHVINYSLPSDPESYVHRIGRTGRAGKTGTAITFITPSEYKTLAFFQKITKADIKKGEIPAAKDIIDSRRNKILTNITECVESQDLSKYDKILELIGDKQDPQMIIKALLHLGFADDLDENQYKRLTEVKSIDTTGNTRLFIALGKAKGYDVPKLVEFLKAECSLKDSQISDIRLLDEFSFVSVPFLDAEAIIKLFARKKIGGRSLVSKAKEKTDDARGGGRSSGGRSGFGRSSFGDRGSRSYGDKKDFGDRGGKSYGDRGPKSYGDKKDFGDKGNYGDRKPYARRDYNRK